jgi:nucleotide-binding universal stress UspA family protein
VDHIDLFGPIRPVLAWHYPVYLWMAWPGVAVTPPAKTMQDAAESTARACLEHVDADQRVEPVVAEGEAGPMLVEVARDAALLVVGARGLGPIRRWLLGSVGRYCADHTRVPLAIIPDSGFREEWDAHSRSGPRRVVVGIDGSNNSEAALRWALDNSRAGDVITAHTAWHHLGGLGYEGYVIEAGVLKSAAAETLTQTVERATADLSVDTNRVVRAIDCGDPRSILSSVAANADLLVVGQRGLTGLPHFLMGSTTTALVGHPVCPTVVVPYLDEGPAHARP